MTHVHGETTQEYAQRMGISELLATNFELARVLAGHPMIFEVGGERICVRLYEKQEYMDAQRDSVNTMPEALRPPYISESQAYLATRPIDLEKLV